MPLPNTASLSDVIKALQSYEGINAKADLASVVGSPATASDTIATINSVIQDAKNTLATKIDDGSTGTEPLQTLVNNIIVGAKYASGDAIQSNDTLGFSRRGNISQDKYITVTGLSFVPKIIIVYVSSSIDGFYDCAGGIWTEGPKALNNNLDFVISTGYYLDGVNAFVNSSGFRLPCNERKYAKWLAITY